MPIIDYEHRAESGLNRLFNDKSISDKNKKDLRKYLNSLEVSPARVGIIARHILILFKVMPDVVGKMNDRDFINITFKQLKKDLKPGYFETIKNVGKAFVRWHNDRVTPKGWGDIKENKNGQKRDLSPEDMITWEDGLELAKATPSVQFKAVVLLQLDGGLRPSEFIDLRFGDIEIKKNFAIARVSGKTGKRDVILFKSVPYLQRWLREHPTNKKDSPLWVMEHNSKSHSRKTKDGVVKYDYWALLKRVRSLGDKISLGKPLDFYNMRHSACYLSKMDNINTELAARKFGHTVKYYTETYGRLSPEDDIKRYSKHYKLSKVKEETESKPITCIRCDTVNEPLTEVCEQCQSPLTMEAALKTTDETKELKEQMVSMQEQMGLITKIMNQPNIQKEIMRIRRDLAGRKENVRQTKGH